MKRNLGSVLALYPTPAVVVGTFVQEKVNWVLVAHVGIIGHNRFWFHSPSHISVIRE